MFKDYKALGEKQIGKQIKIFRSDNGGEFTSNDYIDFYKEVRIRKETTMPYNPEQNGLAKRKNRTIMEVVKSMLHDQKLPKFLWGEATNTIVYVQNRSLHRALNNKKRGTCWKLQLRKVRLLVIVRNVKVTEYTYLVKEIYNLARI